jgi:TetR/AcrR family transcriptional regulator, regulator of biofilm formation and stress response
MASSPATTSPSSPKTAPRGEARKAAITEAALAVIARVGPDGLTHRLVAAEAGLPLAATTYWFASKEDMVRAALEHAIERDLQHVDALRADSRAWTRRTIAAELALYIERTCTERRECAVVDGALWLEALRRPELRPIAKRWVDDYTDVLQEVLRNVGAPATHDDAELLGAAIDGIVSHHLVIAGPFDRATVAKQLGRLTTALVKAG